MTGSSAWVARSDQSSELAPLLWATLLVASKRATHADDLAVVP